MYHSYKLSAPRFTRLLLSNLKRCWRTNVYNDFLLGKLTNYDKQCARLWSISIFEDCEFHWNINMVVLDWLKSNSNWIENRWQKLLVLVYRDPGLSEFAFYIYGWLRLFTYNKKLRLDVRNKCLLVYWLLIELVDLIH